MENTWSNFWSSGTVGDYLIYKNEQKLRRQNENADLKGSKADRAGTKGTEGFRQDAR